MSFLSSALRSSTQSCHLSETATIIYIVNSAVEVNGRNKMSFSTKTDKMWSLSTSQYVKLHLSLKGEEGREIPLQYGGM